jgi:hypothetical protein
VKTLEAQRQIASLLEVIRGRIAPGESVTLEVDHNDPVDLIHSTPTEVLEALRSGESETVVGDDKGAESNND